MEIAMSDLMNHGDVEMPSDCPLPEPPATDRRRLYAHVLDVALANKWTIHQAAEYADRLRANVICLESERAKRGR
jgi:hypothetical protein